MHRCAARSAAVSGESSQSIERFDPFVLDDRVEQDPDRLVGRRAEVLQDDLAVDTTPLSGAQRELFDALREVAQALPHGFDE